MARFTWSATMVLILIASRAATAAGSLVEVRGGALTPLREEVTVSFRDGLATTRVVEVFRNEADRALEAVYEFALPRGATMTDFRAVLDGREMKAEVLERGEARRSYEALVRQARDPGLLEQTGERTFRARVFPVAPKSDQRLEVEFFERVSCEAGAFRYVCPLRSRPGSIAAPSVSLAMDVRSSVPLKEIVASATGVEVHRQGPGRALVSWESSAAAGARDDLEVRIGVGRPATGATLVVHRPRGEEAAYFLLVLAPGDGAASDEVLAKDVTFVVDTSSSMSGEKLVQAKTALTVAIASLRPVDRFNVIAFSSSARAWRPILQTAAPVAIGEAISFVAALRAEGGTAIDDALERALWHTSAAGRPHLILFLTDGLPTVGERDPARILERARAGAAKGARIFTFGVGDDVDARLLSKIAEESRGVAETIAPGEPLEAKVAGLARKLDAPVVTDIAVDLEGLEAFDVSPRRPPDLFAGTQLIFTGRTKRAGPANVRIDGRRGARPIGIRETITIPAEREEDPEIARYFAMRKIADLLDRAPGETLPGEVRQEVIALAKRFRLTTPLTSFFIPEPPVPERPRGIADPFAGDHNDSADGDDLSSSAGDAWSGSGREILLGKAGSSDVTGVGGGGGGAAGRFGSRRHVVVARGGGGHPAPPTATQRAIDWLVRHSEGNTPACATATARCAADVPTSSGNVALSLIAFSGAGHTHVSRGAGGVATRQALVKLMTAQQPDGGFGPRDAARDAIATIALVANYERTSAIAVRSCSERALGHLVETYRAGPEPSTTEAVWLHAALAAAERAGLDAPDTGLLRARLGARPPAPAADGDLFLLAAHAILQPDALDAAAVRDRLSRAQQGSTTGCLEGSFDGPDRRVSTAAAAIVLGRLPKK